MIRKILRWARFHKPENWFKNSYDYKAPKNRYYIKINNAS